MTFEDLDISAKSVGKKYTIKIEGVSLQNLVDSPPKDSPSFTVTFKACQEGSEVISLDGSSCLKTVETSPLARIVFAVLGAISAVIGVFMLFKLYSFKEYHIVRANSYTFLFGTAVGSILSFISLIIRATRFQHSCMVSFNNINF